MDEMKKDTMHADSCDCKNCSGGMCYHCHYGHSRFILLRWILGLIILAIVFWMGVKIGEFKASFGLDYGNRYYGRYNMMYYNNNGEYPEFGNTPMMRFSTTTPQ